MQINSRKACYNNSRVNQWKSWRTKTQSTLNWSSPKLPLTATTFWRLGALVAIRLTRQAHDQNLYHQLLPTTNHKTQQARSSPKSPHTEANLTRRTFMSNQRCEEKTCSSWAEPMRTRIYWTEHYSSLDVKSYSPLTFWRASTISTSLLTLWDAFNIHGETQHSSLDLYCSRRCFFEFSSMVCLVDTTPRIHAHSTD